MQPASIVKKNFLIFSHRKQQLKISRYCRGTSSRYLLHCRSSSNFYPKIRERSISGPHTKHYSHAIGQDRDYNKIADNRQTHTRAKRKCAAGTLRFCTYDPVVQSYRRQITASSSHFLRLRLCVFLLCVLRPSNPRQITHYRTSAKWYPSCPGLRSCTCLELTGIISTQAVGDCEQTRQKLLFIVHSIFTLFCLILPQTVFWFGFYFGELIGQMQILRQPQRFLCLFTRWVHVRVGADLPAFDRPSVDPFRQSMLISVVNEGDQMG